MHSHEWDNPELMAELDAEEERNELIASARKTAIARRLVDKKAELEKAKAAAERAEQDFKATQADFWDLLDDEDTTTVTLELGEPYGKMQFQKRSTIRAKILNKRNAAKALREADLDYMLEPVGFRKRPLNQHVNEALKAGTPLPEGVDFSRTRFVTITKRGSK